MFFECMEIAEYIYEAVVEPCYKRPTRAHAKNLVSSGKLEDTPPR